MGLILDTSVFIAEERGRFDMARLLQQFPNEQPAIAAITASELLHGVARAQDEARRQRRSKYVEQILAQILIIPFDLAAARVHAELWAELSARGVTIGPHDLQIAATALMLGWPISTLNVAEFQRVTQLKIIDARPFCR
jgi:predicted nucleic acid-binding protein